MQRHGLLLLPVILAATVSLPPHALAQQTASAASVLDKVQSSGTSVSPPTYIKQNNTWQVHMEIYIEEGATFVLLFDDLLAPEGRRAGDFHALDCGGFASLCCLERLNRHFRNSELDAYLPLLNIPAAVTEATSCLVAPKPPVSSRVYLQLLPSTENFLVFALPQRNVDATMPRIWVENAAATHFTIEILGDHLYDEWLTVGAPLSDVLLVPTDVNASSVIERRMSVHFAFVKPTPLPSFLLSLSTHQLAFNDLTKNDEIAATLTHTSLFAPCANRRAKPDNALWRADHIAEAGINSTWDVDAALACLWFCKPGLFMYPSTTDYYNTWLVPLSTDSSACIAMPTMGAEILVEYDIGIDIALQTSVNASFCAEALFAPDRGVAVHDTTPVRERMLAEVVMGMQREMPRMSDGWISARNTVLLLWEASVVTAAAANATAPEATPPAEGSHVGGSNDTSYFDYYSTDAPSTAVLHVHMLVSAVVYSTDYDLRPQYQQAAFARRANSERAHAVMQQIAQNATTLAWLSHPPTGDREVMSTCFDASFRCQVSYTVTSVRTRMHLPPLLEAVPTRDVALFCALGLALVAGVVAACFQMYYRAHQRTLNIHKLLQQGHGLGQKKRPR